MLLRALFSLMLLIMVSQPLLVSGAESYQLQSNAAKSLLLDIARAGDHLVAVGERGHLLLGNGRWEQVLTPTSAQLTKVFFLSEQLGWAVGHDATILNTIDGGKSWHKQFDAPQWQRPLMDVLFVNAREGFAIGAYGLFLKTFDGGSSWQSDFHDELLLPEDREYLNGLKLSDPDAYATEKASLLPHFNRLLLLGDGRLLLVGEQGLVALSSDRGLSFHRVDFDYHGSMFSAVQAGDRIYVMGLRGHVFVAGTGLEDWQTLPLPVESNINGALVDDEGNIYFVGNAGVVLKTTSDGDVSLLASRLGEHFLAAAMGNSGKVWLVGSKGLTALESILAH